MSDPLRSGLSALRQELDSSAAEADRLADALGEMPPAAELPGGRLAEMAAALEQRATTIATAAASIAAAATALDADADELRRLAASLTATGTTPSLDEHALVAGDLAADLRSHAARAASLVGMVPAPPGPDPSIWSKAPSGLPFWLGGFKDLDALSRLIEGTPVRGLDLVLDYDPAGPTFANVVPNTVNQWSNSIATRYLKAGKAKGFVWTAHPWCGGANHKPPAAWPDAGPIPDSYGMCPNRPPTFTGNETPAERREKQLRVWSCGAEGRMDDIWRRRFVAMKRDHFNRHGLQNIVLVLRAAHELDLFAKWGDLKSPRCNSIAFLTTEADMAVVKAALARFYDLFLEVFGTAQAAIEGDVAYPRDNLWTYHNPVAEFFMPVDSLLACPDNAMLVGPDLYDTWPPVFTESAFVTQAKVNRAPNAADARGKRGIQAWLDWCKANGRLLAIGEFGNWASTFGADGKSRPSHEGWDNPVFIRELMEFLKANAEHVAFACHFNSDVAPSPDLPGHRIDSWPGIDDLTIPCERTPPGDNHRCSARALRQWLKAQAPLSAVG